MKKVLMLACIAIGGAGLWSFMVIQSIAGLIGGLVCIAIGIYGLYKH